ncbi:hypothetical protein JHK85_012829 [Glycine max]|nr:hypothetical protein JHK85_012829 [Glycine max]
MWVSRERFPTDFRQEEKEKSNFRQEDDKEKREGKVFETLHSLTLPLTLALATSSRPHKSITRFRDELDVVLDYRFLALPHVFVGGIYVGALVPTLLTCLQHISTADLRHRTLSLLLHLSLDDDAKVGLIVEDLLSPLISLLLSSASPSDCRALAATLLTSLTVLHVNKATIGVFPGSIHALVTLLHNGRGKERKEAATTLYALCSFRDNRRKAVECGAVPILLRSTDSRLERSVCRFLRVFCGFCQNPKRGGSRWNGFAGVCRFLRVFSGMEAQGEFSMCVFTTVKKGNEKKKEDLVRAVCQLEASMIQTCNLTPEGACGKLSHDMKAIQHQYALLAETQNANFLQDKPIVQRLVELPFLHMGKKMLSRQSFGGPLPAPLGTFGSQTTKGIWIAKCAGIEPSTIAMDLEGTHGRERGEVDYGWKDLTLNLDVACLEFEDFCAACGISCGHVPALDRVAWAFASRSSKVLMVACEAVLECKEKSGNNRGSSPYNGLHSQVLETKLRLNVDSQIFNDALSRKWIPNDTYLENP